MSARRSDGFLPIGEYAVLGDGRVAALVGSDGSIDWLCLSALDSPSVFGALLDPARGGHFLLAPAGEFTVQRRYLPQTNVLETQYETASGQVEVRESLNLQSGPATSWRELARSVRCLSGEVKMRWELEPRWDYGERAAELDGDGQMVLARDGRLGLALILHGLDAGERGGGRAGGRFTLRDGERALLTLVAGEGPLPRPGAEEVESRLELTAERWRRWLSASQYDGPWREAVERSLLALGLLNDSGGAIAAAATTSLPESLDAQRNYDYRFAWVRDMAFTCDALLAAGMTEPGHSAVRWLLEAVRRTQPRVDPVYSLGAEVVRSQTEVGLAGYRGCSPVRRGNNAGAQLQLGGFGDLLEAVALYVHCGHRVDPEAGARLADSGNLLAQIWKCEDAGLWELGDRAHYTTSKLGCWTAFHRLVELAEQGTVPDGQLESWRAQREAVRGFIETELWSPERQSYLMRAGAPDLDCGVLLAARRGFADPQGERMRGTISALRAELSAGGPLMYRYSGMAEQENAFLACSFWLVEALALAGEVDEAASLMDETVGCGNELGLMSEELHPRTRELRGNFPQALTHLALVGAALVLERCGAEGRRAFSPSSAGPATRRRGTGE